MSAFAPSPADGDDDRGSRANSRLLAHWRFVVRRHRRAAALRAMLRVGVLAAMPAAACWFAVPTAWPWVMVAWVGTSALAAVGGAACARTGSDVEWCEVVRAASPGAGDALLAWAERRTAAPGAMFAWLVEDLADRLPAAATAVPPSGAVRRPVWTTRWLRLAAFVAVLALLLAFYLAPPWAGVLRGGVPPEPPPPPTGAPPVVVVAVPGSDGAPPEPGTDQSGEDRTEPEPTPELPSKPEVVMPRFLADGPSRKDRATVAELPAGAPVPTELRPGGGSTAAVPSAEEFRRAAERAQRSRHVAPDEQAMVRRYFEGLRKAGGG